MTTLPRIQDRPGLYDRVLRLASSRRFQEIVARVPVLRRLARAEGTALFDVIAGFVNAQVLMALVELRLLHLLQDGPRTVRDLGGVTGVAADRMQVLLQAGAALRLLRRLPDGRFGLALRGASMLGVPGLEGMVRHHKALYADLADPVGFLRGGQQTELARFWPYVFGTEGGAEVSATYSTLMAESQVLVAEDTLRMVDLSGVRRLMDVGGGTGAFLAAVGARYPQMALDLFDLPVVLQGAVARLGGRVQVHGGSFREDPLPQGADAISLVRVLYDHSDSTVVRLLDAVRGALPPGGRLIISEPMSGGAAPLRETDVYFAFYTMAMQTGRTRSPEEIAAMLQAAGFANIRTQRGFRPFVTSVVTAERG